MATIDDTEHFENEANHMVGKDQVDKGKDEGKEEDGPHLTVDGPFDLIFIDDVPQKVPFLQRIRGP